MLIRAKRNWGARYYSQGALLIETKTKYREQSRATGDPRERKQRGVW